MKNTEIRKSFTAAFPKTIPIIPGYVFMGIAFGIWATPGTGRC